MPPTETGRQVSRRDLLTAGVAAIGGFLVEKATDDRSATVVRAGDVIVVDDPAEIPAGTRPGQIIVVRT